MQWLHLVVGEKTSVRWAQQEWVSRRLKEGLWVGRQTTWTVQWSEPRRAPPAKASQEAVGKVVLATCPLILNFTGLDSSSARSWSKRTNLGLLAPPRYGAPFPRALCRLTTSPLCQGSFPFFCVCFLCSWPPPRSCHFCGLGPGPNQSQKMSPYTVALP